MQHFSDRNSFDISYLLPNSSCRAAGVGIGMLRGAGVFNVFKRDFVDKYCYHIQDFQDFMKQIFGICRYPSFPKMSIFVIFANFEISRNHAFKMVLRMSLDFCSGVLLSPKIKIIGCGVLDTSKNPEIIEMRVWGLSHKQIQKHYTEIEAE